MTKPQIDLPPFPPGCGVTWADSTASPLAELAARVLKLAHTLAYDRAECAWIIVEQSQRPPLATTPAAGTTDTPE
jgi:hypothetical protein